MLSIKKHSLLYKFIFIYTLFIFIPLLLISYKITSLLTQKIIDEKGRYFLQNIKTTAENTDEILKNIEYYFNPLFSNNNFVNDVFQLSLETKPSSYDQYMREQNLVDTLSYYVTSNNYIDSIYTYILQNRFFNTRHVITNQKFVTYSNAIENKEWYQVGSQDKNLSKWLWVESADDDMQHQLSFYKTLMHLESQKKIGLISINVNKNIIQDTLHKLNYQIPSMLFVLNDSKKILTTIKTTDFDIPEPLIDSFEQLNQEGYFLSTKFSERVFITYYTAPYTNWTYICAIPFSYISSEIAIFRTYTILIFLIIFIFLFVILYMIYMNFYKPIKRLRNGMYCLENGDFDYRLPENRKDEVGYIYNMFNQTSTNLYQLIHENYLSQIEKKESQLKSIQEQINQHFLFNTLDSICWLAKRHKVPIINKMILYLSKFYRITLSHGNEELPLSQIYEAMEYYLYLQSLRMDDRLSYDILLDEDIKNIKVLKYLFQPIIENAIIHGIENKNEGGQITIAFRKLNNTLLRYSVDDTGLGITKDRLASIQKTLSSSNNLHEDDYFALNNINQQLKLYYGSSYHIHIESTEGKGTSVWFDIPISQDEGEEKDV